MNSFSGYNMGYVMPHYFHSQGKSDILRNGGRARILRMRMS